MGLGEVASLDELRLTVVVDNETDTLSSIDAGVPQFPEAAGRLERVTATRDYAGHPGKVVFDQLCCACHGFSVLATGRRGGEQRSLLFDVGPYAAVWKENAVRLGIDLATIEVVFLSHWHFDHSGGLPEVVAAIAEARRKRGLPPPVVDLHPDRTDQRGVLLPSGKMMMLPEEPGFDEMEVAGGEVIQRDQPHPLLDGFFFASGRIDRTTPYETGLAGHYSFRGDRGEPDPAFAPGRYGPSVVGSSYVLTASNA